MHNNRIHGQNFGKIFDDLFNRSISDIVGTDFTHETPAVNIIESDESYTVAVAAPGLTKEDFEVTIEKEKLIISADKVSTEDIKPTFKRREYDYHKFKRMFSLPKLADKESIKAKYELGVLHVSIDKKSEVKEKDFRSIEID